jgi:hypothetical protein
MKSRTCSEANAITHLRKLPFLQSAERAEFFIDPGKSKRFNIQAQRSNPFGHSLTFRWHPDCMQPAEVIVKPNEASEFDLSHSVLGLRKL